METNNLKKIFDSFIEYVKDEPWGVFIAVLFFILGVIVTVITSRKKNNKIEHYLRNYAEVGKGLTDLFPDFCLTYKGGQIKNNAMYIGGRFKNISGDIILKKPNNVIELELPIDTSILDVKVVPSHDKFKVQTSYGDRNAHGKKTANCNTLYFKIEGGLFKSNENFKYYVIFESPKKVDIENLLNFDHRIANTIITNYDSISSLVFAYGIMSVILLIIGLCFLFFHHKDAYSYIIMSVIIVIFTLFLKYNKKARKSLIRMMGLIRD